VTIPVNPGTPPILLIYRERLKPGSQAAYAAIEEETAKFAVTLGCPHPYLAALALTRDSEVWWFNGFASASDQARVSDEYVRNTAWFDALTRNSERKASLTLEPIETLATYRPELSHGTPWLLGTGRFLVITTGQSDSLPRGTVFETSDGVRTVLTSTHTREDAEAARAIAGPGSDLLVVRPAWSFPARAWIAADPEFWAADAH